MEKSYDLVIIGSGSAAMSAAFYCNSNGLKTAVIDSKPFGGTCALRGCDPKKVLFGVTETVHEIGRLVGHGVSKNHVAINWGDLIKFKKEFTVPMPEKLLKSLGDAGIDIYRVRAQFVDTDLIRAGGEYLRAKKTLIAAGARPMDLGIPGQVHIIDNEQFMELEELPKRIVFIGGGYISVEFAGIASRSGSECTILHRGKHILKNFDSELASKVKSSLEEEGVRISLSSKATKIAKKGVNYEVFFSTPDGEKSVECDLVVHGSGRIANITDMGLDKASVEWSDDGVLVNQYMQSVSNPNVYSAGDSASSSGMKLTPVASLEGEAAAYNIVHGNSKTPDYRAIPTVVFSLPPLAMVGLTEDAAKQSSSNVEVKSGDSSSWYNSKRKRFNNTGFKIITDKDTGAILGAHILGDNSEEVINIFSLAIRYGIKPDELINYPFAYPSDVTEIRYML